MTLKIEQHWRVEHDVLPGPFDVYSPTDNWWKPIQEKNVPGTLVGRQVGRPFASCEGLFRPTLTRLTFTAPEGTEFELRDQLRSEEHTSELQSQR